MDLVTLSRWQFAFTISFHYLYPPLSIGLGLILVVMEGLYLKTKNKLYETMAKFWVKIFGLIFAIGVATGIVLEFEFGTNWSTFSRYIGDIFGSALAAEGIFAFFLESGFLSLLLFGWNRVSPRTHFIATIMVALGAHFSAVWIIVANSWMQTPAGYHIVSSGIGTRVEIVDFWAMVFNPSTIDRLTHTLIAAWQTGAWFVLSVSAYYLLRNRHIEFAKASMKIAFVVTLLASLGQLITGDSSAREVSQYQPAKLAAFEGHYITSSDVPLYLFGWVNDHDQRVQFGVAIPGLLSYLVHGTTTGIITGLNDIPKENRPNVNLVFQTYHAMVAIGFTLIGLALIGVWFLWRGSIEKKRWLLWILVFSVVAPHLGNILGWASAEIGRQPWLIYGLLKTSQGVSPIVTAGQVGFSLILFAVVYLMLFAAFIFLLNSKIQHGPVDDDVVAEGKRA